MKPEEIVLSAILKELDRRKKVGEPIWWFKVHGSPTQRAGIPDLLVCYFGRFVGIEVKRPGGEATRLQERTMDVIRRAGGSAFAADSVGLVSTRLDSIRAAAKEETYSTPDDF